MTKGLPAIIILKVTGGHFRDVAQVVERYFREVEAVGSSPAIPINKFIDRQVFQSWRTCFFYFIKNGVYKMESQGLYADCFLKINLEMNFFILGEKKSI